MVLEVDTGQAIGLEQLAETNFLCLCITVKPGDPSPSAACLRQLREVPPCIHEGDGDLSSRH